MLFRSPWLRAQINLMPAVIVYAALTSGVGTVTGAAVLGGLFQDSLSTNPLGVSILPLFLAGIILHRAQDLVLRDQLFAQFTVGVIASAFVPIVTVVMLYTMGRQPLVGWASLWQWLVLALVGGIATPVLFRVLRGLAVSLSHPISTESSHRPDRLIRRGRL